MSEWCLQRYRQLERNCVLRSAVDTEGEWEDAETNTRVDRTRRGFLQAVAAAGDEDDEEDDDDNDDDLGDELAPIRLHVC